MGEGRKQIKIKAKWDTKRGDESRDHDAHVLDDEHGGIAALDEGVLAIPIHKDSTYGDGENGEVYPKVCGVWK